LTVATGVATVALTDGTVTAAAVVTGGGDTVGVGTVAVTVGVVTVAVTLGVVAVATGVVTVAVGTLTVTDGTETDVVSPTVGRTVVGSPTAGTPSASAAPAATPHASRNSPRRYEVFRRSPPTPINPFPKPIEHQMRDRSGHFLNRPAGGPGSGLAELEAVAEGVGGVEAAGARNPVGLLHRDPRCLEPGAERAQVVDDEAGMGLAGGHERVLDPDVQLLGSGPEPAPTAGGKRGRLLDLLEPEQAAVEGAGRGLAAGRRRHLHVVDPRDRHGPRSTIDRVTAAPPRLEDTLVRGYTRLAAESPHRRIDAELRALDLFFGVAFSLLLLPFALVIAAAVLATTGRPVLYRGRRVGRGGHFFDMLKFRTLRPGAEERIGQYLGEELVQRTEAELTRIGRFLKASQLDEIPQLWNVLLGHMSFVGPRPIRPRFFAELAHQLPAYWQRLVVRPGLTGFAQVRRGYETSMAEKLAHDLEWIADRSVPLYLRTLLFTALRVVRQSFSALGGGR
jgi:lipopolysaccharide/colanic/teichoic acid biosynthesis glycosyltransferase